MLLTGPLQSWGGPAPGVYERPTSTMPSLSAIVGIVANALGRKREDDISDLADGALLAVRADRPGTIRDDFHTAGTPGRYALAAGTRKQLRNPIPTRRQYLEDAAFLAVYTPPPDGVAADHVFQALLNPARPLYLGRRSCPPAERIPLCTTGIGEPIDILEAAPLLREPTTGAAGSSGSLRPYTDTDYFALADIEAAETVHVEMTAPDGADPLATVLRPDKPITFEPRRLHHEHRHITRRTLSFPPSACTGRGIDAVAALYDALGAAP